MRENFQNYFGRNVQDAEFNSWQNSLQYVKNLNDLKLNCYTGFFCPKLGYI